MEANDPNLDPQVHGWQDLCREPLDIAKYFILLYKLWAEDDFSSFPIISLSCLWELLIPGMWLQGLM